ncbi:MAG: hypothetical protein QF619_00945, partial [Candidatus Binatia bacterium]|nr:hypothetical protein [Candidatus Binatia bacterium]
INQTVGRVLDQFGIELTFFERWSDKALRRHPELGPAPVANQPTLGKGKTPGTGKVSSLSNGRHRRRSVRRRK